MKGIFLLLGSNMGDKLQNLQNAVNLLSSNEIVVTDSSSVYESAPWGNENQAWFLNMVLRVDTQYTPEKLLEICLACEETLGRKREVKWGERLIDIDILYFDNYIIASEQLTIPHPAIALRRFTLMPLVEIIPNEKHPLLNTSQSELLNICPDLLGCRLSNLEVSI